MGLFPSPSNTRGTELRLEVCVCVCLDFFSKSLHVKQFLKTFFNMQSSQSRIREFGQ